MGRRILGGNALTDGAVVAMVCGAIAALASSAITGKAREADQVIEIRPGVARSLGIQQPDAYPWYMHDTIQAPRPDAKVIELRRSIDGRAATRCPGGGFEVVNPDPGEARCP